jgi:hypothetical protein
MLDNPIADDRLGDAARVSFYPARVNIGGVDKIDACLIGRINTWYDRSSSAVHPNCMVPMHSGETFNPVLT